LTALHDLDGPFEAVAEAEADTRGRVTIARAGARPGRRYRVYANMDGVVVLEPVVSIPEREMLVWEKPELAQQIREGIAEAEAGRTTDLGSFAQFLTDEDDDEQG
jgi:hypothetical protein